MFLSTEKTKVVHANKDNIEFYNRMYEESKSEAAREAAIELAEYVRTHQPNLC